MGQKTVRFSDLSGQLIMHDDALARIVVHEHPELGDVPVEIEALTEEAETIEDAALRVAVIDLYLPDDIEPRRIVMEADAFDKLATQSSMAELLTAARPVRRSTKASASGGSRGDRLDYTTLEHAGKPHKGKITDTEKQLVHDHLDEINERLTEQGLRAISLTDPEHVERYGLQSLAQERTMELEFGLGARPNSRTISRPRWRDARGRARDGAPLPGPAVNRPDPAAEQAGTWPGLSTSADRGGSSARPRSSPSVLAQAPAAVTALDEAQARQLSQAPQHGIEVHSGLDRDGGSPGAAAGGQRVEYPGAIGVKVVTGGCVAVREERAAVTGGQARAPRPGVRDPVRRRGPARPGR